VPKGGNQIGEAFAGAGAGLYEQVLARGHRVLDGGCHGQLSDARLAADALNSERKQLLDVGNLRSSHGSKGNRTTPDARTIMHKRPELGWLNV
jgi:hypothetical protein